MLYQELEASNREPFLCSMRSMDELPVSTQAQNTDICHLIQFGKQREFFDTLKFAHRNFQAFFYPIPFVPVLVVDLDTSSTHVGLVLLVQANSVGKQQETSPLEHYIYIYT